MSRTTEGSSGAASRLSIIALPRLLSLAALLSLAVGLLAQTWRCWGDVNIDFPEELYVPWQLSEGKVLYRDINHYYGPLSQYYHSLLFRLFGPSYLAIALSNFAFILADTALLYAIFAPLSELAALAAGLSFLGFHAFQQVGPIGTYNFMGPYSQETVHGVFVWFAAMWAILGVYRSGRRSRLLLAGLLLGTSVLLKPEFPLAIGLSLLLLWRRLLKLESIGLLLAGVLAPLAIATVLFSIEVPLASGVRNTFGAIMPIFESEITRNPFYLQLNGFIDPYLHLADMGFTSLLLFGVIAAGISLDGLLAQGKGADAAWLRVVGVLLLCVVVWYSFDLRWFQRGVPFVLAAAVLTLATWARRWWQPSPDELALFFLLLCGMVALQPKILLRPVIAGFGFYLCLPLTLAMVLLNVVTIPSLLARLPFATGKTFRLFGVGFFCVVAVQVQALSRELLLEKSEAVGSGADLMYGRGDAGLAMATTGIRVILERIETYVPSDGTLAVIPEGMLLNYLARRDNPTPYMADWVSRDLFDSLGGSVAVIATIEKSPPDFFIFLFRRNEVPLPGYEIAGPNGYAKDVIAWIKANYERIEIAGPDTDDFNELAYQLWKRRS